MAVDKKSDVFNVKVVGRIFRVTVLYEDFWASNDQWCLVDIKDIKTGMESQAVIQAGIARDWQLLMTEDQFRDALKASYMNATTQWQNGRMVNPGGKPLSGDFLIERI